LLPKFGHVTKFFPQTPILQKMAGHLRNHIHLSKSKTSVITNIDLCKFQYPVCTKAKGCTTPYMGILTKFKVREKCIEFLATVD